MGFDFFSAALCLYGGSLAGIMCPVSPSRMKRHYSLSFGEVKEGINYTGTTAIGFRIAVFLLFTSLIILFNIWYCSRNKQKKIINSKEKSEPEVSPPPFQRTQK